MDNRCQSLLPDIQKDAKDLLPVPRSQLLERKLTLRGP